MNSELEQLLKAKRHYEYADKLNDRERQELEEIRHKIRAITRKPEKRVERSVSSGPTIDDAITKIQFFMRPKQPRVSLPAKQYLELKKYIWHRDKWCVFCGRTDMLTPAHIKRRSAGGHDAPNNIVVACQQCHDEFDQYKRELPEEVAEMLEKEPTEWVKK